MNDMQRQLMAGEMDDVLLLLPGDSGDARKAGVDFKRFATVCRDLVAMGLAKFSNSKPSVNGRRVVLTIAGEHAKALRKAKVEW